MPKIKKLTQEQERGIIEWREYCLKIGKDTSPVNKELTEKSWKKFYQILKKEEPSFWYCQSPLQAQIIINIFPEIVKMLNIRNKKINIGDNIWDNIRANIVDNTWENIRDNIGTNIEKNIGSNIRDNIKEKIWDDIGENIGENIEENIKDNIEANIGNDIKDNIEANIWDNICDNIGINIWENIRDNIREKIWDNIGKNSGANIRDNIKENIGTNIGNDIIENFRTNIVANIKTPILSQTLDNFRANIGYNIRDNIGEKIWDDIGENIWVNIRTNIKDNIWESIEENIEANIGDNIKINIKEKICDNIEDNIWVNIWRGIWDNIWTNIKTNIWDDIGENIGTNIRDMKLNWINTYSWCQHDINWIGYYKYFEKYGLLPYDKNFEIFNIWYDLACSCGWCYTFENMVFVCEKPCKIFLNNKGQLHKDMGLALEYSDGYGLYMLNGVRVNKEIVMTPSEKLNPELLLKEENAEVRKEIIRKVGMSILLKKLNAKLLDTWREYELYRIENIDIEPVHILKMRCPSKDLIYTLRIPPEINKAYEARVWISNGKKPEDFLVEA
jgi:hypothetical protein